MVLFHRMLDNYMRAAGEKEVDYEAFQCMCAITMYGIVQSKRYLQRGPYRSPAIYMTSWCEIFNGARYNEADFVENFRTSRDYFVAIVDLVRGHDAFASVSQRPKLSPELHILAVLYFLGAQGNGASASRVNKVLGVGKGSVSNLVERGITAILSLKDRG